MSSEFIEVKDGISISADAIEAVIDISDPKKPNMMSKVYTANNSYPSTLTRQVILQMISLSESGNSNEDRQMLNIMKQQTNFAG